MMIQCQRFINHRHIPAMRSLNRNSRFLPSTQKRLQTNRSSLIAQKERVSGDTSVKKTYWQAQNDFDIQRVTQNAIIHELTKQQTETIESVVPWFLNAMPVS